MADAEDLAARCDALEIRSAEQEQTIEELNAALTAQWREIEALRRELRRLGEQVGELESASAAGGVPVTRPPHY